MLKSYFGIVLLLASPAMAADECSRAVGQCSYIDATGRVRVSYQMCLQFTCQNEFSTQTGMQFLNGTNVVVDHDIETDDNSFNGDPGVQIFGTGRQGPFDLQFRTSKGEFFLSRQCADGDEECDLQLYPEFWESASAPKMRIEAENLGAFPVQFASGMEDGLKVVFQELVEGKINTLARKSPFEYLELDAITDLDGDGLKEIVMKRVPEGNAKGTERRYEFYASSADGIYRKLEGDQLVGSESQEFNFDEARKRIVISERVQGDAGVTGDDLYKEAVIEDGKIRIVLVRPVAEN